MKHKALSIILVIFLGLCNLAYALDIPDATSDFYVNDFAGIFSNEDFNTMMEKAIELDKNYNGIQVVVTTMKTLNGESLEIYANKMFNKYGIGKNDMGLLILMVTEDRLIRVETGSMMEAYFADGEIVSIMQKQAYPYLKKNKFAEGIVTLQDAYITAIKEKVDAEIKKTAVAMEVEPNESTNITGGKVDVSLMSTEAVVENEQKSSKGSILLSIIPAITVFLGMFGFNKKSKQSIKTKLEKSEQDKNEYISKNQNLSRQLEYAEYRVQEYSRRENSQNKQIERYTQEISEICNENRKLNLKNVDLQGEIDTYKKKLEYVHLLHPNIDSEIEAWIAEEKRKADMQVAAEFDTYVASKTAEVPSMNNESLFKQMLNSFQSFTDAQRSFVTADVDSINQKYVESVKLRQAHEEKLAFESEKAKAEQVKAEIENEFYSAISPTRDYCDKLERLMRKYNHLSENVKFVLTAELINALRNRIDTANELAEEEERRRREERARREAEECRLREERERREAEERRFREERERREAEERRLREERERREAEERRRREEERKRKEEEERRRRQRMSSSYSSNRSSFGSRSSSGRSSFGSFRGHGGSSRGGGASGSF